MKIKDLLTDESKWTKGKLARSADGQSTQAGADDAVCWCLVGAIFRANITESNNIMQKIDRYISKNHPRHADQIAAFNDAPETTFQDIRKLVETLDI